MTNTKEKKHIKELCKRLYSINACDGDCWGRCEWCPNDIVNEAIKLIEENILNKKEENEQGRIQ